MPEEKGNFLTKKLGPQPRWAWVLELGGAYLVFRWYQARQAANAANAATALTGGTSIPAGDTSSGSSSGSATTPATGFSTLGEWETAALSSLTGSGVGAGDALNGISSWLNGNCVSSAVYNGLSSFIGSAAGGLPPGYGGYNVPTLSVCSNTPNGTPGSNLAVTPATIPLSELVTAGQGYTIPASATGGNFVGGVVQGLDGLYYSTIASYQDTIQLLNEGQPVYYMTAPGQLEQINSVSQFQQLENNQQGPQTTTWTLLTGTPGGQPPPKPQSSTITVG